jgi:DNA-binding GntR family transcriptional regulator
MYSKMYTKYIGVMTPKIVKTALYVEVTERLRSMVAGGVLKPGSWIDEQKLSEKLGVSRTPFREAIRILASEGILRVEPRKGCYVTELTDHDLNDIFPLMAILEGRCAYEAAQKANLTEIKSLESMHEKLKKHADEKNIDDYFMTNQKIHEAIQALACNEWLTNMVNDLRRILNLSRHRSLHLKGRIEESCQEHLSIFAALKSGDAAEAERLMKAHILRQREVLKLLQTSEMIAA